MHAANYDYTDQDTALQGFLAYDDSISHPLPAVIVAHDWAGRSEFACLKAQQLASMGYVGFALDMYGEARLGNDNTEKSQLMQPLVDNRKLLLQRVLAAFNAVSALDQVDSSKIAAIGYCFGGLCVLDLARSGAKLNGVVSFHGALSAPELNHDQVISAKLLVLHGYDDPMVRPDQVQAFAQEMNEAKVDWQINMYGNAMHAFTNPMANDPGFGTVYDEKADQRSWLAMTNFLQEIF